MGKVQDQLKKARSKREKAKNEGVKDRIRDETAPLWEEIRDLKVQLKTLMRQNHVTGYCMSAFYYSVYFPSHVK